jgi:hypothetical protein
LKMKYAQSPQINISQFLASSIHTLLHLNTPRHRSGRKLLPSHASLEQHINLAHALQNHFRNYPTGRMLLLQALCSVSHMVLLHFRIRRYPVLRFARILATLLSWSPCSVVLGALIESGSSNELYWTNGHTAIRNLCLQKIKQSIPSPRNTRQ